MYLFVNEILLNNTKLTLRTSIKRTLDFVCFHIYIEKYFVG